MVVLEHVGSDQLHQPHLSGHSLRVSCCSALFACDVNPSTICLWCGWAVTGSALQGYLRIIPVHPFMR